MTTKDFDAALKLVLRYEGGYCNDPDDPGGETYKGISRRNHGAWAGWSRIDAHKGQGDFSKRLEGDARLQTLVADVYKGSYWLSNLCDQLPAGIDLVVFDTAVNMGSGKAGRFLQQGVNKLLARPVLKVDGVIGVLTLAAVNGLDRERQEQLCSLFLTLRTNNYYGIAEAKPKLKKFLKGWLNRVANLRTQVAERAFA